MYRGINGTPSPLLPYLSLSLSLLPPPSTASPPTTTSPPPFFLPPRIPPCPSSYHGPPPPQPSSFCIPLYLCPASGGRGERDSLITIPFLTVSPSSLCYVCMCVYARACVYMYIYTCISFRLSPEREGVVVVALARRLTTYPRPPSYSPLPSTRPRSAAEATLYPYAGVYSGGEVHQG